MQYDVFNGDADGIFALQQLRLANPAADAVLITGVKRDINLLKQIEDVRDASVLVLDVSLDTNRTALLKMLENRNHFLYVDHHYAGNIPQSSLLDYHIEPSADTCTSLLVNGLLEGRFPGWAICGAFGDNLHEQAQQLAASLGLTDAETERLRRIGELFNYNGYGAKLSDLHVHPAELYHAIQDYANPLQFYRETSLISRLQTGYDEDMAQAAGQQNISSRSPNRVYRFPAAAWARRITGVFSNYKAREKKDAAHAIIVENSDQTFQISVRAPLSRGEHADTLCRKFPTGGGRAAAAGINHLPPEMLDDFLQAFYQQYR